MHCFSSCSSESPSVNFVELISCMLEKCILWKSLKQYYEALECLASWPLWTDYDQSYDCSLHLVENR